MNVNERSVILLIKSAITGEKVTLPEGADILPVAKILSRRNMVAVLHMGLLNSQIQVDPALMERIADLHCVDFMQSERQMNEIAAIEEAFEKNGIEYMPLKGTIMKAKYPDHAMRYMSDADILIREDQRAVLEELMPQLGFSPLSESDHEWNWIKPELKLELHKRLVSTDDPVYYSYFGNGWQFAKKKNGCRYEMTEEDAFIFEVVHFTRHYCVEGISIRHLMDLWVHMYCAPNMDRNYVREQLKKMRLDRFYDHLVATMEAWFYDGEWNDVVELISNKVFGNAVQENQQQIAENARAAQRTGAAKTGKLNLFLSKAFPAKKHLDWNYPQLKKVPLVFAWIARWFILLTQRSDTVKENYSKMQEVSQEQLDNYRADMELVGLQFPE